MGPNCDPIGLTPQLIGHFALVRHFGVNGCGLEIAQVEIEKVHRKISDSIRHLKP
jgi:hypothetical protein